MNSPVEMIVSSHEAFVHTLESAIQFILVILSARFPLALPKLLSRFFENVHIAITHFHWLSYPNMVPFVIINFVYWLRG